MPKTNTKTKKAPRANAATPKDASPSAEESSPKATTSQRVNGATLADPTREYTDEDACACHHDGTKATRRTRASKRTEVRLPGPYVEPAPSESGTDTPNPDLITGDEDSTADSPAPRATKPSEREPASANTAASKPTPVEEAAIPSPDVSLDARKAEDFVNSSDSQDPKSSTSATPPTGTPPERSSLPEDSPDPVD
ncbi:unnamed protein product [Phytophthora fragariaefolia]|uniref:Unnamed protein product n=1 Tax=Phytophthora fragariaefolia TaxID=1490495 RepID=A0A9W6U807_9STRA|nr:unnamed protein product [Phytophthora fragariaefolia]